MRNLLIITIVMSLASAGCIETLSNLKGAADKTSDAVDAANESLDAASTALSNASAAMGANTTTSAPKKAPVARVSVFGTNGALIYKSTFTAEDPTTMIMVEAKSKLSLIASDSEAVERGATLVGFAWTMNGKPIEGARQATVELTAAGLYTLGLTVTDSNGKTDVQTVKIGIVPEPYDVVLELMTGPVAGAEGAGQTGEALFSVKPEDGKGPALVQKVVIVARPDVGLDAILTVTSAEGSTMGEQDSRGHSDLDQTETIELGAIATGDYLATITPFAGADPDGVAITVTITFLPVVEGLEGGDHGGHAGH